MENKTGSIAQMDNDFVWHPLTQHKTSAPAIPIIKAKGALLYGEDGATYIDGISSWYTTIFGHCHPFIIDAVQKQMQQLDFAMFSGFTHLPAAKLAQKLIEILPENQAKVFYNDNGSTAVEAAIKMAIQYFHNTGVRRDTIIAFENGFHGDTFGAMSASGILSYNAPFKDFLLNVVRLPVPTASTIDAVEQQLANYLETYQCSAFIFEPLVQGAAGMQFYEAQHLDRLIKHCQDADVLCIADEIMTGFGKTGTAFASDQLAHKPDIICLSKALTAGMFPLSVTTCTQKIFNTFLSDETHKGFFHAHTYSAHPLGCAAALASISLFESSEMSAHQNRIATHHKAFKLRLSQYHNVCNVRTCGPILAFELTTPMERYGNSRQELYDLFMSKGVCLRPLGNTIYVLPPYITTDAQLHKIYAVIEDVLGLD